jgi:hypothetical protein
MQKSAVTNSSVSGNGRRVVPAMKNLNMDRMLESPGLQDVLLQSDMRSESRLKIFSGTANQQLAHVLLRITKG